MFPAEREPDTNRFAPHHHLLGCYVAGLTAAASGMALGRPPVVTLAGVGIALFAFIHLWYDYGLYPVLGSIGSLLGLAVAFVGALLLDPMLLSDRVVVIVALLVAADDAIQHSFGIETPLNWLWDTFLWPLLR